MPGSLALYTRMWNGINMKAIQVVMDERLLKAADREAKRRKINRSALLREALWEHLKRRRIAEVEEREREAYARQPADEFAIWEKVQVWPED
jgi:metal-responsive CopG/Arc/MetJ family transcriptional regulator